MKVNIKNHEIELRFNFKSEMLFEEIRHYSFAAQNTSDWLTMFFCSTVACGGDSTCTFDEFIEYCNEDPNRLYDFIRWYSETITSINALAKFTTDDSEKKSQKKRSKKSSRES